MVKTTSEEKEENLLEKYLKKLKLKNECPYYVQDTAEGYEKDIKILFVLESPHKEEVKEGKPLVGKSGENVSDYIYKQGAKEAFGELHEYLLKHKIGIINVSNIPLQVIKENEEDARSISKELSDLRDCDEINSSLLYFFCEKMKKYENVEKFVVCGNFASVYFDKYIECDKQEKIKENLKNKKIELLKVPHPSYKHWQFIDKHKDNLERLKEIFSEFNEK